MPPFLGQGLCAGIRDAANLAWKLDAVQRHGVGDDLLDTYGEERKAHLRTIVEHAKSFGLIIGELDEKAARERDRRLEEELLSGRAQTVRQKFIPGLTGGLIDRDAQGHPAEGAGVLFVQPWVTCGEAPVARLDDLVAGGFLIATATPEAARWLDTETREVWRLLAGQLAVIATASAPADGTHRHLIETESVFKGWLDALGALAVVVRPDHYT